MPKGIVAAYDPKRGSGVIIDEKSNQNLTVYANYIVLKDGQVLQSGQKVEYEIETNRGDSWAINVRILSEE